MIVHCDNCDTRFQLDESRVPQGGVRVRCSRCKKSFFLAHPDANAEEVARAIAEDAAGEGHLASPEVTRDLVSSEMIDPSPALAASPAGAPIETAAASRAAEPQLDTDVGPVLGGIGEDEDWQFNEETPEAALVADVEGDEDSDGVAAFGSVDDFSSLIADVAPLPEIVAPSAAPIVEFQPELAQQSVAEASVLDPAEVEGIATGAEDSVVDDPEDWNFFSDTPSSDDHPPPTAAPVQATPALSVAEEGDEPAAGNDSTLRRSGWVSGSMTARVGSAVGWMATISLVALGLAQGLFLEKLQPTAAAPPLALGSLVVDALVPSWIDNQHEGRILAVRGRLFNPTSRPVAQDRPILVALLDGSGSELAVSPSLAALSLPVELIRELPADELRNRQQSAADALARSTLAPGQSIAFTALFEEVPAAAKGVGLQTGLALAQAAPSAPSS